jgi:hypothetical protein
MAISSNYLAKHALIMPRRSAHAAHTPNQILALFRTQLKARHRICGRRCKDSWVYSRITRVMASPLRRRVMVDTTVRCLTVSISPKNHQPQSQLTRNRVLPLTKRQKHPRRNRHKTRKRPHRKRLVRPPNPIPSLLQLLHLPWKHLRLRSVQRIHKSRMVQQPLRSRKLPRPDQAMLRNRSQRHLRHGG